MSFIPLCAWSWAYSLSPLRHLATSWTVAHQAPLSKEFFRQEYCSGSLWPPPGDLPEPGIQPVSPVSPALQADSLPDEPFVPFSSVQFSRSVCLTLCDPMKYSTPGLPVHRSHPKFIQTHVDQVSDTIQPSHPLSSPSPPAPNPSQHQSLFQWVNSSHEVAKVLEFQLYHHSFQITPRTDLL